MNKFPISFQTDILLRVMKQDELNDIYDIYRTACHKGRANYEPTKADILIFHKTAKKLISFKDAAKELGVTLTTVKNRFAHIGLLVASGELKV